MLKITPKSPLKCGLVSFHGPRRPYFILVGHATKQTYATARYVTQSTFRLREVHDLKTAINNCTRTLSDRHTVTYLHPEGVTVSIQALHPCGVRTETPLVVTPRGGATPLGSGSDAYCRLSSMHYIICALFKNHIFSTMEAFSDRKMPRMFCGRGTALDPAGEAYDAPQTSSSIMSAYPLPIQLEDLGNIVSFPYPISSHTHPTRCLRCLDPHAFGARHLALCEICHSVDIPTS